MAQQYRERRSIKSERKNGWERGELVSGYDTITKTYSYPSFYQYWQQLGRLVQQQLVQSQVEKVGMNLLKKSIVAVNKKEEIPESNQQK